MRSKNAPRARSVRFSDEEWTQINAAANVAQMSAHAWLRYVALEASRGEGGDLETQLRSVEAFVRAARRAGVLRPRAARVPR